MTSPSTIGDNVGYPFCFGLMMGCVSHLLLGSTARVVLDTMDAFFVCFAIDRDHGIVSPVGAEVHAVCSGTETYFNKDDPPQIWQAAPMAQPVQHVVVAVPQQQRGSYQPVQQPYAPYTPSSPPPQYGYNPNGGYVAPAAVPMGGYAPLKQ
jgi:hypothetical protein